MTPLPCRSDGSLTAAEIGHNRERGRPVVHRGCREVGTEISPEDVRGPTRLAMVDDHELTRESLQNMLSEEPDIEIVGEAANGRQALLLCSRFRPDLILMDVRMPVMDGLAATKEVKQRYPEISVMMLTMHGEP